MKLPRLRGRLPTAWGAIRGWESVLPWKSRVPVPLEIAELLFLEAINLAAMAMSDISALMWLTLGVLWILSFHGLLRPGEALGLHMRDVTFSDFPGDELAAVIALAKPKTRHVPGAGRAQFAVARSASTARWLRWLVTGRPGSVPLWRWTRKQHYDMFQKLLRRCELGHLGVTPASGRASGTTHLFMKGNSLEQLSFLGRWVSVSSLRSYIQEAGARLTWSKLSEEKHIRVAARLKSFSCIVAGPPPVPLSKWLVR